MRPDNTAPIIAAAKHRRELTRAKAIQALRELDRSGTPITFLAVAHAAGVSRSWLYAQPDTAPRSNDSATPARTHPHPSQRASAPPTPHSSPGWKPPWNETEP